MATTTHLEYATQNLDALRSAIRTALETNTRQSLETPWGELVVSSLTTTQASIFAARHDFFGTKSRDMGVMVDPNYEDERLIRLLRLMTMRAAKFPQPAA